MTVSTEVDHNEYTGNGVTTSFPYTFRIFRKSDLVVQVSDLNGNVTELVLDTGYTVTGAGTYSGGSVVLPSPLATGWRITIDRVLDVVQETDLRNQGKFFPEVHEDAFDYLTMLIQQCFGWFRRALMKPSLLAKYYDAKQNKISNLADPASDQDATNRRYLIEEIRKAVIASSVDMGSLADTSSDALGDALLGVKQPIALAIGRTQHGKNAEYVSVFDFGAIGDGALHPLSERFTTLAMAQVAYPFVTSLTQSIDWAAIQAAVNSGLRVRFTSLGREVDYVVNEEIAVRTTGQVLEFDNAGGYGYADYNFGSSWQESGVRVIAMGSFARRIRTRRIYRASSTDPQDAPLSVVFNIQADGVQMYSPCIWLNCDYSNPSPTNFGDDCDVGIFIGTRCGVQIHDPVVIGYFRKVGIYFDVTQSDELPRFPDINGVPYPDGSNKNLGDGTHIYNPYIRGSRIGLGILGARPKPGQNTYTDPYYDQVLGASVPDYRGRGGFSDFMCLGGRIFGPDHHSGWRLQDPTLVGGALTQAGMESEPDFSPAAVYIDGLSNNASSNLWGMRFFGTRIATWEMFRVRLDKASRVVFDKCHIEGRNSSDIRSATGAALSGAGTNDYTLNTYGAVSGTSRTTRCAYYDAVTSTVEDTIPHWYGTQFQLQARDGSRIFMAEGGYISTTKGNLDLRAPTGSSILMRNGATTVAQVSVNGISLGANNTYRAGSSASAFSEVWARGFRTALSTGSGGSGPGIYGGEGSPEGVVTAIPGSLYLRGGPSGGFKRIWKKESGNGNTGWVEGADL